MNVEGRVVLVTGGARRVGRAIATALAADGARVAVHYGSSAAEARATVAEINSGGGAGEARAFQSDLRLPDAPQRLSDDVANAMGTIDVLVNSAAIMLRTPVGETTVAQWDEIMAINLRAPFFLAQAASRVMPKGSVIVNIADLAAFETWTGYIPHGISKAGVVQMTRALAHALGPAIRVNAVAPGVVMLPEGWTEESADHLASTTPLRRLGDASDVVEAVRYLIGAEFVTGHTVVVDGGRLIRR